MRSLSSRPAYASMPNGHAPGPVKCPRLHPRAARQGHHSPCRARGRGRCRTSRPSPARCPPAACAPVGQVQGHRARDTAPSGRRRSRAHVARRERRADRTTRNRCRARSHKTRQPRATPPPRSRRMRRLPMPDTRPQLTHGHKSVTLASGSTRTPSAFVLKGHSRTLPHHSAHIPGGRLSRWDLTAAARGDERSRPSLGRASDEERHVLEAVARGQVDQVAELDLARRERRRSEDRSICEDDDLGARSSWPAAAGPVGETIVVVMLPQVTVNTKPGSAEAPALPPGRSARTPAESATSRRASPRET